MRKAIFIFYLLALGSPINTVKSQTIRVLSYNIHHGEDMNGNIDLQQLARIIRAANPDLVALQEVDSVTNRTQKVDQLKELAALTQMHYFYGKNMDFDGGGYGVGILSKYPIIRQFVTRLPHLPKSEPRVAATVEVRPKKKKPVLFTSVHLDYVKNPAERIGQAKKLQAVFSALRLPSILAGDFNAQPGEATLTDYFYKDYEDTDPRQSLSFPSKQPVKKIDYVLVSKGHTWKKKHYEVIDEKIASDHRPVLSVVKLK